jgi:glycosyltransferase involved in cell wall biosynthesis
MEDSNDQNVWSGLVYYMRQTLEQHFDVAVYDKIPFECPLPLRIYHQFYKRFSKKIHHLQLEPAILKKAARRIEKKFYEKNCDAVFCPGTGTPVSAFINPSIPVFSYMDVSKLSWIKTYFGLDSLCARSKKILKYVNRHALVNNTLNVFSSNWALQAAVDETGNDSIRTAMVPFGANLLQEPSHDEVLSFIESRDPATIKLLFLGKEWKRKGGDIAVSVLKALQALKINAELHIIGCTPEKDVVTNDGVIVHGFVDRSTSAGSQYFKKILAASFLLLFFSSVEAYGLALCEANAYGVPCIATNTGGIPTIIRNGYNGYLIEQPLKPEEIALQIKELLIDQDSYKALALHSRKEYEERLNWQVAGKALAQLITKQLNKQ